MNIPGDHEHLRSIAFYRTYEHPHSTDITFTESDVLMIYLVSSYIYNSIDVIGTCIFY